MHFYPKIYQENIYQIPYDKLYQEHVRCLLFDLDNTLGLLSEKEASEKVKKLFQKLEKRFIIVIVSNHVSKRRVSNFAKSLHCEYFYFAMKPSTRCFRKIMKKFSLKKEELCMIGDQLITDVLAANRFGITACLVEPLSKKDLKITSLNRILENYIIKYYQKKKKFKKGEYYG